MIDVLVVNASPLILLGRIAQVSLLERLSKRLIVPSAVVEEIEAGTLKTGAERRHQRRKPLRNIL